MPFDNQEGGHWQTEVEGGAEPFDLRPPHVVVRSALGLGKEDPSAMPTKYVPAAAIRRGTSLNLLEHTRGLLWERDRGLGLPVGAPVATAK